MAAVTEFKALQRKKKRKKFAKALLIIFLILAVTFGFSKIVNSPSFVGIFSFFELFKGSDSYPLNAPGGKTKGMYQNAGDLILLNETNLYMYNSRGAENLGIQHRMANPQIVTKGNMTLNYDRGSKSYSAYNRFTPFVSTKTDYAIKCGDISSGGEIIFATQSDTAQTNVIMLDEKQRVQYDLKFSENIVGVAISQNGNNAAVASIYVENGVLNSKLTLLHRGEKTGERIFEDELILEIHYSDKDTVQGISDNSAFLCNPDGTLAGQYEYQGKSLAAKLIHDQGAVLVFGDFEHDRKYDMVSLADDFYTVNGTAVLTESIQKVKALNGTILVLGSSTLKQFSVLDCELLSETEADYMYDIQPMGNYVYAVTNEEIIRVELEEQSKFALFTHQAGDSGSKKTGFQDKREQEKNGSNDSKKQDQGKGQREPDKTKEENKLVPGESSQSKP